jgi:mono/diheme cytochrome c family protein
MQKILFTVCAVLLVIAFALGVYGYSGLYNVGADDPHTNFTYNLLQTVRNRSIRSRSADLKVADLGDPQLILKGAGQYAAMCTGCHLKPGLQNSELREGMYPKPPNLATTRVDARDAFWVIKHGIKMSAMPAWGASHDDATIWSMVAFLQRLPGMTPQQYKDLVAQAPPDEDMEMDSGGEHTHSHGEVDHDQKADPH